MSKISNFQWPWQYSFPPFFTIQPNNDTRSKQVNAWCDLVLEYFKATKNYILDVNEAQSSPLFCNNAINSIQAAFNVHNYVVLFVDSLFYS